MVCSFIITNLRKIFMNNPGLELKSATQECIRLADNTIRCYENENQIKLKEYEIPSASLAIVREDEQNAEIFLLGDTETIIGYTNGQIERVDNPNQTAVQNNDNDVIRRMVEIGRIKKCSIIDTMSEPEIQKMLQINRAKKNVYCEGGYWICGNNPEATEHGVYKQIPKNKLEAIILASDGFDYSLLGLTPDQVYAEIIKKGYENLVERIRIEENSDPNCNKHPRFKKSDDLSVVLMDERVHEIEDKINDCSLDK